MITVGILTVSDKAAAGEREDLSGATIMEMVKEIGGEVRHYALIPDEKNRIATQMKTMADQMELDLVLTTGGTGLSPTDVTPEATMEVIDKQVPGIVEAMRAEGFKSTPNAVLSRAVAGVRKKTLVINLPGSPKAVRESLSVVLNTLPHAIEIIKEEAGECAQTQSPESPPENPPSEASPRP